MSCPTSGLGSRAYRPPPSRPLRRRRIPLRRSRAQGPRSRRRAAAHHRSIRRSARRCARRRRASPRPPCTRAREGRLRRSGGRGSSSHPPALRPRADPAGERDPAAGASRIGDPASRRCRIVTAPGPGRTGKRHARGHSAPQRSDHSSGRDSMHPGAQEQPGQGAPSPAPGPQTDSLPPRLPRGIGAASEEPPSARTARSADVTIVDVAWMRIGARYPAARREAMLKTAPRRPRSARSSRSHGSRDR